MNYLEFDSNHLMELEDEEADDLIDGSNPHNNFRHRLIDLCRHKTYNWVIMACAIILMVAFIAMFTVLDI